MIIYKQTKNYTDRLTFDHLKAFDSKWKTFPLEAIKLFGYCEQFITWMETLLTNLQWYKT